MKSKARWVEGKEDLRGRGLGFRKAENEVLEGPREGSTGWEQWKVWLLVLLV